MVGVENEAYVAALYAATVALGDSFGPAYAHAKNISANQRLARENAHSAAYTAAFKLLISEHAQYVAGVAVQVAVDTAFASQ